MDYSDPLGGVLSWISDISAGTEDFELKLVGVVTDPSRSAWAGYVDADAPASIVPVHRDEVKAAERVTSVEQLPKKLHAIISGADIYIPNAYETGYRIGVTAHRLGVPSSIVAFSHADEPHYSYLAQRYEPLVSKFLAADTRSYEGMLTRLPHRREDIVRVPHGLHVPPESDRCPDPELRLLFVGRIVQRQKQVFDLIALAKALRGLGTRFRTHVIGDGDDRAEFAAAAAVHAPEISCLGPMRRQEVLRCYRDYDCFILCSSFEGMSVALMEAMAHGVVPVVTRVGGASDLIADGVEGFMWPVGEVSAAAQRLHELWRNPDRLRSCARAARERIVTEHDPARCAERLLSVLRSAAACQAGSEADAERLLSSGKRSPYFPES